MKMLHTITISNSLITLLITFLYFITLSTDLHFIQYVQADTARSYKLREAVPVLVNYVGPFNNPAETYPYYSLRYCKPKRHLSSDDDDDDDDDYDSDMGEVLSGDRRQSSVYDIRFKVDEEWRAACPKYVLTQDDIKQFMDAISQHYVFELFLDDLSVKGFVGEVEHAYEEFDHGHVHNDTHYYLFTHLQFSIAYNALENTVISVNLTTDPQQRIELAYGKNIGVEFSYSVHWVETDVVSADRIYVHSRSAIGEQSIEIHWLSIVNSFVLVILLTAFLAVILMRVLRKDFARYMSLEDEDLDDDDIADEVGWKLVHGDVFRYPPYVMLFSSAIGNGAQILVLVISMLCLAVLGTFYVGNRGAVYSAAVVLYAITAYIAGYVSTTLYLQLGGTKWASASLLTASLYAVPFFCTFIFVNSVASYYGSTAALPVSMILLIIAMWMLVSFPLTIFGSLRAKRSNGSKAYDAPCKTNRVEREIPGTVWYRHPALQLSIAGFLPFSAIYIELHYIFQAVYSHRVYTLFGILSLAFLMLLIVTAFITVALTYFQLAAENYKWWWRSFHSGASVGVFIYMYAIFYYTYRSDMSGTLQSTFFFSYMAMLSYGFSLMLGAVSYTMASLFVKHIYKSIKID